MRKKVYFKARIAFERKEAFAISDVNRALGFDAFETEEFTGGVEKYVEIHDGNMTVNCNYIYNYAYM